MQLLLSLSASSSNLIFCNDSLIFVSSSSISSLFSVSLEPATIVFVAASSCCCCSLVATVADRCRCCMKEAGRLGSLKFAILKPPRSQLLTANSLNVLTATKIALATLLARSGERTRSSTTSARLESIWWTGKPVNTKSLFSVRDTTVLRSCTALWRRCRVNNLARRQCPPPALPPPLGVFGGGTEPGFGRLKRSISTGDNCWVKFCITS